MSTELTTLNPAVGLCDNFGRALPLALDFRASRVTIDANGISLFTDHEFRPEVLIKHKMRRTGNAAVTEADDQLQAIVYGPTTGAGAA